MLGDSGSLQLGPEVSALLRGWGLASTGCSCDWALFRLRSGGWHVHLPWREEGLSACAVGWAESPPEQPSGQSVAKNKQVLGSLSPGCHGLFLGLQPRGLLWALVTVVPHAS